MVDKREVLAPGTVLIDDKGNEYVLGGILGKGSSGLVYSANMEGSNLELAIKEIFPVEDGIERTGDGVTIKASGGSANELINFVTESAKRELVIGSKVSKGNAYAEAFYEHLNITIVQLSGKEPVENNNETNRGELGQFYPQFYLSVSLKDKAEQLDEIVERYCDKMQIHDCLLLINKCLVAIQKLHEQDVIHLDISAKNFYLFGCETGNLVEGVCKVIDFGMARKINKNGEVEWDGERRPTHTPGFGAPEIKQGKYSLVSKRTDVYSLGTLFYFILYSGRVLEKNERALLLPKQAEKIGALCWYEKINDILLKATSENINERYEDAGKMQKDVGDLLAEINSPEELIAPIDVPRDFDNREDELVEFLKKLKNRRRLYIWGESGIGKTTFTAMLLERYMEKHPQARVLFVRYDRSILEAIAKLWSNKEPQNKGNAISLGSVEMEERFYKNMAVLREYSRDDVLCIDNFYSDSKRDFYELSEEEGEYYRQILQLPIKIVFTTRYRCEEDELGALSLEELSRTFFSNLPNVSEKVKKDFCERLGYNTYLIRLVMSSVEQYPTRTFGSLYKALTENEFDFEVVSEKDGRFKSGINFQALLEKVWNVVALPPDEQTALYICAMLIPKEGVLEETFNKCIHWWWEGTEVASPFNSIIKKSWLILNRVEGKYFLHDLARVLIKKYVEDEKEVWEFLWRIAENGGSESCASLFAYTDMNNKIKMGIYFWGIRNYKRSYHYFYNCLSTMYSLNEKCIILALDGIRRCIERLTYQGNEVFYNLCIEQIIRGLSSENIWGNIIIGRGSSHVVDLAYEECIASLCSLLGYDSAAAFLDYAKRRRESNVYADFHKNSYFFAKYYDVSKIKETYIAGYGDMDAYSYFTRTLLTLIIEDATTEEEYISSFNGSKGFLTKWQYVSKVEEALCNKNMSKWLVTDSVMGLVCYLCTEMYNIILGNVTADSWYDLAELLIARLEMVDSVMVKRVYLYYGLLLRKKGAWRKALEYLNKSMSEEYYEPIKDRRLDELLYRNLSEVYYALNQVESAVHYRNIGLMLYMDNLGKYSSYEHSIGEELRAKYEKMEALIKKKEYDDAYCIGEYHSMNEEEEFYLLFCDDMFIVLFDYTAMLREKKAGELKDPIEHFEHSLMTCKKLRGLEHPETIGVMCALGKLYRENGEIVKAKQLIEQAFELSRVVFGGEHPMTIGIMDELAWLYKDSSELSKAQDYLIMVLEYTNRRVGEESIGTLSALHNLASMYYDTGEYHKAEEIYGRAYELCLKHLGKEHPDTTRERESLALACEGSGKLQKAQVLYEQSMETSKEYFGLNHSLTIMTMIRLGRIYIDNGENQKAMELLEMIKMSPDEKEAYRLQNQLTQRSTPSLQCELAAMHLEGRGVVLSAVKAFELYKEAAEQGSDIATFCIAILLLQGRGTTQDVNEAFKLFKEVAEQGHPNAQFMVSLFYGTGRIVNKNEEMAKKWYEQALHNGVVKKAYDVNKLFWDCDDARNNLGLLVAWHEHTSYQQFPISRCNLGYMYEKGWGVELDKEKAREWYEKAADQGDVIAKELVKGIRRPGLLGKLFK